MTVFCPHSSRAQPPIGASARSEGRSSYLFPVLRIGAGPRFELDGENAGEWNIRAGIFYAQRLGERRSSPWYRVELDFGYLRHRGGRAIGGGVVGLIGPLPYVQVGYSFRVLAADQDGFRTALRNGLATRIFGGLFAIDLEHERVPSRHDSAIVLTVSVDLAALVLAGSVVTGNTH